MVLIAKFVKNMVLCGRGGAGRNGGNSAKYDSLKALENQVLTLRRRTSHQNPGNNIQVQAQLSVVPARNGLILHILHVKRFSYLSNHDDY